jgi:hypothetical protein
MTFKAKLLLIPALLLVAFTFNSPARADLIGSQVTLVIDYPTFGNVATVPVTATVGSGLEFPFGSLLPSIGITPIPVSINLTGNQIAIDYTAFSESAVAPFNGYVFNFSGLTTPITGVSLDPLSSLVASEFSLGFSGNQISANGGRGIPVTPTTQVLIDVDFGSTPPPPPPSTVPEPNSLTLFGSGALGLIGLLRRRFAI